MDSLLAGLDAALANVDAALAARVVVPARQPVHTVYVPADLVTPDLVTSWGAAAFAVAGEALAGCDASLLSRVRAKLSREPIEDLRIDFEDGYGIRSDDEEDAAVDAAVLALPATPFVGLRCKSLEAPTRARAVRTLDRFIGAVGRPVLITLPKVSFPEQVTAMVQVCEWLESAHGLAAGALRFEIQIETPLAVLSADGSATVARLVTAADGRCAGLHFGTYDYTAGLGIAAAYQALDHPAADHAKAVMQVAVAGTGIPVADGSTNVLPVGVGAGAAWALHARLVRRSLERGFYQGWDLHPAQLPTRYAATYAFFRDGLPAARSRLLTYLSRRGGTVLDEPATARALAGFLLRGLNCGAFDGSDVDIPRSTLESL